MNMDKNHQDDWFDKLPTPNERNQFREAMLDYLAERGFGTGDGETMRDQMPDILDRLQPPSAFWNQATAR